MQLSQYEEELEYGASGMLRAIDAECNNQETLDYICITAKV